MKVVFMGTPEFAVPSLKTLIASKHPVVGCVTVPDKPAGRGQKLRTSPVKQAAQDANIPVLQPHTLKNPDFVQQLADFGADLFAVVAFRILPDIVFSMPAKGTVNVHASLLPKYRGAAPINWALIGGEHESGVTTFFIEKQIDTGLILLQKRVTISRSMTAGDLHDNLAALGADALLDTVNGIEAGTLAAKKQQGDVSLAPKLTRELCRIDWDQSAVEIHNLVRGLSPFPGSYTYFRGKLLKILRTELAPNSDPIEKSGAILEVGKHGPLLVNTTDGAISILEVKPEGKKRMSVDDFIRGYHMKPGERFSSE